jgi:hypothetical protein
MRIGLTFVIGGSIGSSNFGFGGYGSTLAGSIWPGPVGCVPDPLCAGSGATGVVGGPSLLFAGATEGGGSGAPFVGAGWFVGISG